MFRSAWALLVCWVMLMTSTSPKPIPVSNNGRYCGTQLSFIIDIVCGGQFLSWDTFYNNPNNTTHPLKFEDGRLRVEPGIDCCMRVCTNDQLKSYCLKRR